MAQYSVHGAKTHFSRLIEAALAGEEVIIARGNVPTAKLVPLETRSSGRKFGVLKGKFKVGPEFFDPLDDTDLDTWDGEAG